MKKVTIFWITVGVLVAVAIAIVYFKSFWSIQNPPTANAPQTAQLQTQRAAQQAATSKQPETAKVASLMFDNQQQTVAAGSTFSLKALVDPKGKKANASKLEITFDPKMLKLESIEPSDGFSLVLANAAIDNNQGTASISLGVPLGKPAFDSVSPIATFNFQTLSTTGQTKVSFTDKAGVAAENETGNIVSSLVPATIIVQ